MMQTWRRFLGLSHFERRIVLESAVTLISTRVGLHVTGFRRWKGLLLRLTPSMVTDPATTCFARIIARTLAATERHLFFRANCLERSLALWWLLRRRGIPAELRIGGRKENDQFEAHAWVEWNGAVLSEPGDDHLHFVAFDAPAASMETQTH
ncbi:MAG: lasso peptide biosynthesis B2 protein [Candidatus Acidiferrales bacterium]